MIKLFKNFLLLIIGVMLGGILIPLSLIYTAIKLTIRLILTFKIKEIIEYVSDFMYAIASAIDQLGCVICREPFNDLFIKKGTYKFGHEDEKISSVLGKAKEKNKLMFLGKLLSNVLDFIDTNHVIKSIDRTITYYIK